MARLRISERHKAWLLALPDPNELRFVKQTSDSRSECANCGQLDRAVTSQPWITWYGPITCGKCGERRRCLRQVTRQIDLEWLFKTTGLRTEADYRSAIRERDEVIEFLGVERPAVTSSRRKRKGTRRR